MKGSFLFLGTGASSGVPMIGCHCAVCSSPRNRRYRPSGLVKVGGKSLLIDIGPDFHAQAVEYQIDDLDGLILTHTHYDHIAGIDELRVFNIRKKKHIPCLLSKESLDDLKKRYYYFFEDTLSAKIEPVILPMQRGQVEFLGVEIGYCSFHQMEMKVNGYRFGDFAYISDIHRISDSVVEFLQGVKTLVLSALKQEKSPFHLSFEEAVTFADRLGVEKTWLTHIGHFMAQDEINALLPPHVRAAYDGLELELEFSCKS